MPVDEEGMVLATTYLPIEENLMDGTILLERPSLVVPDPAKARTFVAAIRTTCFLDGMVSFDRAAG